MIPLDEASNCFTARFADLLQGIEQGILPEAEQRAFYESLRHVPLLESAEDNRADLYFVHDFQLAPLAQLYSWMKPTLWMCHIDTANPDPHAIAYIEQFLDVYNVCVFNSPQSVFKNLPSEKTHVIMPTIDPFSEKNRFLSPEEGIQALKRCGIDPTRPLITQVSRFSVWKNPHQVIDVYRMVKQQLPSVQVALVGAMEAADDIKSIEVLKDLQEYAGNDHDIHLLSDPALITHSVVNAFQRYSSVVLQRSVREGFGLTVTEAMWKGQPVVGTSATGLRMQILDGRNGYVVDDTEECAQAVLRLIYDRDLWRTLGWHAHTLVRDNYLLPEMALEYLDALEKALGMSGTVRQPQTPADIAHSLQWQKVESI
ncbi:MAG: glycosyltransferase [Ktedonobacteraceae bacterium]|nr:glycosyltransferase [Ktedonobacteraceae bacterium]